MDHERRPACRSRLRAALLGHLAGFEMTSVVPMSRYAAAAVRLQLGPRVRRFYDVHVDADEHHGALASGTLVGGDLFDFWMGPKGFGPFLAKVRAGEINNG